MFQRMRHRLWILLVIFPSIGWGLTLSQIQTQVRRNINDTATDTTLQRYSDATLTEYINEAQREVVNLSWCVSKSTSYVLTSATTYYSLPSDYLATEMVTFTDQSNVTTLLTQVSEKVQYQTNSDFENTVGQPTQYFTRMPDSGTSKQIAYVPIPDSTSTGTVTVSYVYQPAEMSDATDTPFDGFETLIPYHGSIVSRTTAFIKQIEGKTEEAAVYMNIFDRYMIEMNDRNGELPDYLPSARGAAK